MHILWTILVGFLAGLLAKFVFPGKENLGFIMTTLLGIGGALLATYLGQALHFYQAGERAGFIGAIVGALVILFVYSLVRGKSKSS